MKRAGVVVLLMAVVSACSSARAPTALPTTAADVTTSAPATTTPTVDTSVCNLGSSPAVYTPASGDYATFLTNVNTAARTMTFDVIQWLSGEAAVAAYHKDHPGDPNGPPNDYYIVNASTQTFTAPVSPSARIRLVRLHETGTADLKAGTFEELPAYLAGYRSAATPGYLSTFPFWLTLHAGTITDVCEQYRP